MVPVPSCNKSLEDQHQVKRKTFGMLKSFWIHKLLKSESTSETKRSKPTLATRNRLWWVPVFTTTYHHEIKVESVFELHKQFVSRNVHKKQENPLHDFTYLIFKSEFHQDVLMIDFKQNQWRPASGRLQRLSKTLEGNSWCPPREPLAAQTLVPNIASERNTQTTVYSIRIILSLPISPCLSSETDGPDGTVTWLPTKIGDVRMPFLLEGT